MESKGEVGCEGFVDGVVRVGAIGKERLETKIRKGGKN